MYSSYKNFNESTKQPNWTPYLRNDHKKAGILSVNHEVRKAFLML
ncbi:hypothetical protein VCHA50P416_280012 [Vibrio chagasii]|nr:hypothetical protein VCHA42P256_270013 [Vibrio chagasii]CAH7125726.1 hypothetical protein VCHA52P454_260012 [Vibrio chagasii]CAH7142058.1 hypothetical protein VCHA43P272_290035 [Vibrio chagasii]CAH7330839.1 hypothetical protein VCHA50P416_280012 [Vibrio chagasii]